jgi:hypothetical protein
MSTAKRLDELEARLRVLADQDEIETLKARYWRAIDAKRPDEAEACFTEDAIVDFDSVPRCESRAAFMEIVRIGAARPAAWDMHHGHHPRIVFTGPDTATGEWDIFYHGIDLSARSLATMAGTYTDSYVRRNGTWLIASTTMRQTSLTVHIINQSGEAATPILGRAALP